MRKIIILTVTALLLTGCFNLSAPAPELDPDFEPFPAPAFQLEDLSGNTWSLEELQEETVVLYFWTASCPTCVDKLPDLADLAQELPENSKLLLLNHNDSKGKIQELVADPDLVVLINSGRVFQDYGVRSVPTMVFIDGEGMVRAGYIGPVPNENILRIIEEIS